MKITRLQDYKIARLIIVIAMLFSMQLFAQGAAVDDQFFVKTDLHLTAENDFWLDEGPGISNPVNVPDAPVITFGVQETQDVAALFFKLYEAYLKASADGVVNFSDLPLLIGPAMLLIPAFSGASQIVNEIRNLNDEYIKILLAVADNYELGKHAQRAKQMFKTILVLAQTYFVFNNN